MVNSEGDRSVSLFALQPSGSCCLCWLMPCGAFSSLSGCRVRWPRQVPQPSAVLSLKLGMKHRVEGKGRCSRPGEKAKSTCWRAREARIGMLSLLAVPAFSMGREPLAWPWELGSNWGGSALSNAPS